MLGPLAIVGACIAWGLDNNLTRKISLANPLQIVELNGLTAGPFNLVLSLLLGATIPRFSTTLIAGVVGFVGYGISLVLFVLALRGLGTARTSAYFSTAPFIGSAAAIHRIWRSSDGATRHCGDTNGGWRVAAHD